TAHELLWCYWPPSPVPLKVPVAILNRRACLSPGGPSFFVRNLLSDFYVRWLGRAVCQKTIGVPVNMRDRYLTRAAELHARSRNESDQKMRRDYETLARQFLRLAEQARHKECVDPIYEPPPLKIRRQS